MFRAVRLILPGLLALSIPLPALAATFVVTKTADTLDGACDRDCSLREAVAAANADEPTGGADVVVVPPGIYLLSRIGPGEDGNATGDLDLLDQTILVGAGPGVTILDGFDTDRVLDTYAPVEIFGVTIRNGTVDGDGGGLLVRPGSSPQPVLLRRSVVTDNEARGGGHGGGIAAFGVLEVRESAILKNQAEGDGGGIASGDQGTFSLTNVTISGNRAQGSGGGLHYRQDAGVTIAATTIVVNHAQVSGGGIFARTPLLPGELAPQVLTSVVAINTAPDGDCAGASSYGYNVFGNPGTCTLDPTDRVAGTEHPVFDSRAVNLGPTPVHALGDRSPAANLVPAAFCEPADQVGQVRTAPCEAGAWERVLLHADCVPGGSILCLQGGRFRVSATWRLDRALPGNAAQAVPLTDDTGNYWFFSPDNLELMVKVLDGCALNQRWWIFASGLTNVGVDLEVLDLETFRLWLHRHLPGEAYSPQLDTNALPCAPLSAAPAATTAAPAPPEHATRPVSVLAVTKTEDTDDGACDHDCSLREAVLAANARPGTRVIVAGPGLYTLSLPGAGENGGHGGDLDVAGHVVILGAGARKTIVDGGGIDRVLDVRSGSLDLHGLTIRNGRARSESLGEIGDAAGGGIRAMADLRLTRSAVESNRADAFGGGIWAFDPLTMRDSTVSGNRSDFLGGGIAAGRVDLENVTLSGNQAADEGGGFFFPIGVARLSHVTITGNSAPKGGGLAVREPTCPVPCFGPFEMERTVIAGNTGAEGPDCHNSPFHTGGSNLFGVGLGCTPEPEDEAGTAAHPLDPRLTPLGDHGGPTATHALLPDSPAIDAAPSQSCLPEDQRGRRRPADGDGDGAPGCDAGAVERLPFCQPDADTLCLGTDDRFRVTARWTALGTTGPGKAVPLALDTGTFWFFDPANVELTVKVLDGCTVNQRFWVFVTGLTNVNVELTVEDTATGRTWTHTNPAGQTFAPRLDTDALDVCG